MLSQNDWQDFTEEWTSLYILGPGSKPEMNEGTRVVFSRWQNLLAGRGYCDSSFWQLIWT